MDAERGDRSFSYPATLLQDVWWTFRGSTFADQTAFAAAVQQAQDPEYVDVWRPGEVVLHAPRVRVSPDIHWYLSDVEPVAELTADNGESFTASELLYKIHNSFVGDLRQM